MNLSRAANERGFLVPLRKLRCPSEIYQFYLQKQSYGILLNKNRFVNVIEISVFL